MAQADCLLCFCLFNVVIQVCLLFEISTNINIQNIYRLEAAIKGNARKQETLSLSRVSRVAISLGAATTSKLEHVPVKYIVVCEALSMEQVPEQLAQIAVVWFFLEPKRSTIVEIGCELARGTFAQNIDRCRHLFL